MNTYITRIELHGASDSDYQALHARMEALGFIRTVVADSGVQFDLPTAMYRIESDLTTEQVRDMAKESADASGRANSWILTIKSAGIAWNLHQRS